MSGERTLPIRHDLTGEDAIIQGADWSRYFALEYIDPATGQLTAWNTTGFTARMSVRADYDSPVLLSCTTENGRLQVGDPAWTVKITLTNAVTAALNFDGIALWDLELIDTFAHVTRAYHGRVAIEREVSR